MVSAILYLVQQLTSENQHQRGKQNNEQKKKIKLRTIGIEPMATWTGIMYSTTELSPQVG